MTPKQSSTNRLNKQEGLKKLHFYDRTLWVIAVSVILINVTAAFDPEGNSILMTSALYVEIIAGAVAAVIMAGGMIYHERKRDNLIMVIVTLLGGWLLFSIAYYLIIMRNAFKNGEGTYYSDGVSLDSGNMTSTKKQNGA